MPSVLVPLPGAPGDHQTRNAEVFAAAGRRGVVPDAELDGARLARELDAAARRPGAPRGDGARRTRARPHRRRRPASPTSSRRWPRGRALSPVRSTSRSTRARACTSSASVAAGMSAIATVLAAHGPPGQRLRPARLAHASSGSGCSASTSHVGHDAGNVPDGVDAVDRSTAIAPTNPEVRPPHDARACPVLRPRRRATRDRRRRARTIAVAGQPRQDHDVVDARADPRARPGGTRASSIGGDLNEVGTNAVVRRRRVARRRGRRERRHVPRARARGRDRHQRRARPPRPLRRLRRARRRVRRVRRRDPRAAGRVRRRRRRRPPRRCAPGRRRHVRVRRRRRLPHPSTTRAARRLAFALAQRGRPLGDVVELPVPGRHNATNAAGAAAMALELGVPFDAVQRARSAGFGGRGPPVPVPRRARRRHLRRRLRAPPERGRRA